MAKRGDARINTFLIDSGVAPLSREGVLPRPGILHYRHVGKRMGEVAEEIRKRGLKSGVLVVVTLVGITGRIRKIDALGNVWIRGHRQSFNYTSLRVVEEK
ncbi:MAG TPA: hypothetical protein VJH21_02240 [Candidatus Paceibacterota bacterium]